MAKGLDISIFISRLVPSCRGFFLSRWVKACETYTQDLLESWGM